MLENGTTRSPAVGTDRRRTDWTADGRRRRTLPALAAVRRGGGGRRCRAGRRGPRWGARARRRTGAGGGGGGAAAAPAARSAAAGVGGVAGVDHRQDVLSGDPPPEPGADHVRRLRPCSTISRRTTGESTRDLGGRSRVATGTKAGPCSRPGAAAPAGAASGAGRRRCLRCGGRGADRRRRQVVAAVVAAWGGWAVGWRCRLGRAGGRAAAAELGAGGTGAGGSGRERGGAAVSASAGRAAGAAGPPVGDHRQAGAHLDGLALGHQDLATGRRWPARAPRSRPCPSRPRTAARRGHRLADRLDPAGDRPLGDGLAELRHGDVSQRAAPFRSAPAPSRRTSRTATGAAG